MHSYCKLISTGAQGCDWVFLNWVHFCAIVACLTETRQHFLYLLQTGTPASWHGISNPFKLRDKHLGAIWSRNATEEPLNLLCMDRIWGPCFQVENRSPVLLSCCLFGCLPVFGVLRYYCIMYMTLLRDLRDANSSKPSLSLAKQQSLPVLYVVTTHSAALSIRLNSRAVFLLALFSPTRFFDYFLTAFYHCSLSDFYTLFPTRFFIACFVHHPASFFIPAQLDRRLSERIQTENWIYWMRYPYEAFRFYCTAWFLFHFTQLADIVVCFTTANSGRSSCQISHACWPEGLCEVYLYHTNPPFSFVHFIAHSKGRA